MNTLKTQHTIDGLIDSGCKLVNIDLVGKTVNLSWPVDEHDVIARSDVYIVDHFDPDSGFFIKRAPYAGGSTGQIIPMPPKCYYKELSSWQKNMYIPPIEQRTRAIAPDSLCPESKNQENYPIVDPEHSFLSRQALQDTQTYLTHDNGGRPFKVLAHQNAIEIWVDAEKPIWDEQQIYNRRLAAYTDFLGLWPGYDTNKDVNHNTILIQLSPHKYVYVGELAYSFETTDEIINYFSPLGNNDVPYAVAYGQDRVYFMFDWCYIMNNDITIPINLSGAYNLSHAYHGNSEGIIHRTKPVEKINFLMDRL